MGVRTRYVLLIVRTAKQADSAIVRSVRHTPEHVPTWETEGGVDLNTALYHWGTWKSVEGRRNPPTREVLGPGAAAGVLVTRIVHHFFCLEETEKMIRRKL
jgi:hypothetical protein